MLRRHEKFSGQRIAARYTFSANRHFSRDQYFQQFTIFTRVAARSLHGALCVTTRSFNFFVVCRKFNSGADGIRTHALRRAKAALSRLSYGPDLASWGEFTAVAQRGLTGPEFGGRARQSARG
jgi:hypothetical protein